MKTLFTVLAALAPCLTSCLASASICSQFNGQFIDDSGHKQIIKSSADCKTLTWQNGGESKLIKTDSLERAVTSDFARYDLFVKASYDNDHQLSLTYRLEDADQTILSISKSVYQITVTDLVRLTETNFVIGADGKETQQSQKVLLQVH